MAITIYPPLCEDFSTNGLGVLAPLECTVEEQAAGLYELKLVHPIDDTLRWAQITAGCIIKAPVPVRETPLYEFVEDVTEGKDVTVERRVYRVRTNGGNLHLRQKPSTSSKILSKYKPGTEVVRLKNMGNGWFQVSVRKGGAQGYMYSHWLEYVRTVTEVVSKAKVVGQRTVEFVQSRDQLFRVSVVETDSEAGTVTATAQHIFYDLRGNLINDAYEPENVEAETVIGDIEGKLLNKSDFTIRTLGLKGKVTADYGYKSPVEALLDPEEGVAAQAGALVVRDNYDVYLLPDDVRDNGVTVRRGKNLRGVTVTTDMTDVVTRIIPEGKTKKGDPLYLSGTKYVDSPRINDYPTVLAQRIEYNVKVVDKKADKETTFTTNAAARTKLQELAEAEFSENGVDLPTYGMEVDFVLLQEPEDYAALQSVYLYDTVTVIDELIGLKAKVRVTGYSWNALTCQYERVTLGELQELQQTVYSYNLPNKGISGSKIANGSVDGAAMRSASIEYAKISVAAIEQLTADSIVALTAKIQEIVADQVVTDELYAALAELNRAVIEHADIQWANIQTLKAAMAAIAQASIGTADIGWAQIKDLITGKAIISEGVGGKLFISRLAVTEANMVSLTTGELVVRGADGRFYAITVDDKGNIHTELKQIGNDDVTDVSINAGEKIIEGSVTAACLNAQEIFADSALIRELIAANLNVDTLFAREAFMNLLRTSKIVGGKSLEIIVSDAEETRQAIDDMQVGGRNLLRDTQSYRSWIRSNSCFSLKDGVVTLSARGKTSNTYAGMRNWIWTGNYEDLRGKTIILSFDVKSEDWASVKESETAYGLNGIAVQVELGTGEPYSGNSGTAGAYWFGRVGNAARFQQVKAVDGEWLHIVSVPIEVNDAMFTNDASKIGDPYLYMLFRFMLRRNGTVQFRNPKIEFGNIATDWTPAPEDVDASIDSVNEALSEDISNVSGRVQDCVTHEEQEAYLRVLTDGVHVGRSDANIEALVNAAGSFDVLVNGQSVTSLGNRVQRLGNLTIYETIDGGHAFI